MSAKEDFDAACQMLRVQNELHHSARPRGCDSAQVVQVIRTEALAGRGRTDDPSRKVIQYWDFDGRLLATYDPCDAAASDDSFHQCGYTGN